MRKRTEHGGWWIQSPGWVSWLGARPEWLHGPHPPGVSGYAWDSAQKGVRPLAPGDLEAVAAHRGRTYQGIAMEWDFWWGFRPPDDGGLELDPDKARRIVGSVIGPDPLPKRTEPDPSGAEEAAPIDRRVSPTVGRYPQADRALGDL